MSDDLITIKRSELRSVLTVFAQEVIRELGLKSKPASSGWISKNEAIQINPKVFGRKRLDTAIKQGLVKKKPQPARSNSHAPILVWKPDVENCIKNRTI